METNRTGKKAINLCLSLLFLIIFFLMVMRLDIYAMDKDDDYPLKYKFLNNEVLKIDTVVDEWNFYNRECTSFVAWRLNSRNGIKFTNWYGGQKWGHAKNWGITAKNIKVTVDMNPEVGSVWWSDKGTYGHVAWVKAVNGNEVTIEEYNYNVEGEYNIRSVSVDSATGYIHINDINPTPSVPQGSPIPGGGRPISDGDYHIVSALEGDRFNPGQKCLTIGGLPVCKNNNGANAELWSVMGFSDHVFTVTCQGDGTYKIKLKDSDNKCLDVYGGGLERGTTVHQYEDNGTEAQRWVIDETSDGVGYTIRSKCNG